MGPNLYTIPIGAGGVGEQNILMKTLGERLKYARGLRKLGANQLDKLVKSRVTSRLETGARGPRLSGAALVRLAEELNVSERWLQFGDAPMERPSSPVKRYGQLEGWEQATKEAVKKRGAPEFAIHVAGELPYLDAPSSVDADLVIKVARYWLDVAPTEVVEDAERAFVEARQVREEGPKVPGPRPEPPNRSVPLKLKRKTEA